MIAVPRLPYRPHYDGCRGDVCSGYDASGPTGRRVARDLHPLVDPPLFSVSHLLADVSIGKSEGSAILRTPFLSIYIPRTYHSHLSLYLTIYLNSMYISSAHV